MNTILMQKDVRTTNTGFNKVTAGHTKRSRGAFLVSVLLVALGALSVQAADKDKKVTGVYTLTTVNGKKLPTTISHEGHALEIRSGTCTINTNGWCTSRMTFVPPSGTEATVETKATYTVQGRKLNMQRQGAGKTTGTVEGSTFTMENEGMVLAYKK